VFQFGDVNAPEPGRVNTYSIIGAIGGGIRLAAALAMAGTATEVC